MPPSVLRDSATTYSHFTIRRSSASPRACRLPSTVARCETSWLRCSEGWDPHERSRAAIVEAARHRHAAGTRAEAVVEFMSIPGGLMAVRWILTLASGLAVCACARGRAPDDAAQREAHGAFEAARGVTNASDGNERGFRVVPLGTMRGDVEILSGHPDSVGRPFVMRIRELPGTVVPPHSHPVDEHITVVSGTLYFGTGERFDSSALRELNRGAYAF